MSETKEDTVRIQKNTGIDWRANSGRNGEKEDEQNTAETEEC